MAPTPFLSRPEDEIAEASAALAGYLTELVGRKRKEPGDDLISVLTAASDAARADASDAGGGLTEAKWPSAAF